jgi:hypothetical protein
MQEGIVHGVCSTARIASYDAVAALLQKYQGAEFDVRGHDGLPGGTISFLGDDWPWALNRQKYGLHEDHKFDEAFFELVKHHGDRDFLELLQELGPWLETDLTLQFVEYVQWGNYPIKAREWIVRPRSKDVEINRFKHSEDVWPTV